MLWLGYQSVLHVRAGLFLSGCRSPLLLHGSPPTSRCKPKRVSSNIAFAVPVWHKLGGAREPDESAHNLSRAPSAVSGSKLPPKLVGWTVFFSVEI